MALAAVVLASFTFAGPGPQYWQTLRKTGDFKQLKGGDKIAYVCTQCQTVSEVTIESPAAAMEHCKEGATVSCPMCKKSVKVTTKRSRNDPPTGTEQVVYVNDKGEECMFVAKVAEKK